MINVIKDQICGILIRGRRKEQNRKKPPTLLGQSKKPDREYMVCEVSVEDNEGFVFFTYYELELCCLSGRSWLSRCFRYCLF